MYDVNIYNSKIHTRCKFEVPRYLFIFFKISMKLPFNLFSPYFIGWDLSVRVYRKFEKCIIKPFKVTHRSHMISAKNVGKSTQVVFRKIKKINLSGIEIQMVKVDQSR